MKSTPLSLLIITSLLLCAASKCSDKTADKRILSKIDFDLTNVSDEGMIDGITALDYEFCIPKDETKVNEVKAIIPDVNMPRMAKGRIRCSEDEWLCIVSSSGPDWKKDLYAIASLPYVKKIVATYYE